MTNKVRFKLFLCCFFVLTFLSFSVYSSYAAYVEGGKNQYGKFRAVSPKRFIALTHPKMVPVKQAKLADTEWVIGMKVGNDTRCYPVRQMWYHHVVNDELGGQKLSLTY